MKEGKVTLKSLFLIFRSNSDSIYFNKSKNIIENFKKSWLFQGFSNNNILELENPDHCH